MQPVKLFCFPYAGGSSVVFSKWKQWLDPTIKLIPVELAGRGARIQEELYEDLPAVIDDVLDIIKDQVATSPYALFGHSMGSLVAYELAQKIRAEGLPQPVHLFFSGGKALHVKRDDEKKFHRMSDEVFKKEVIELGGTPPEFFEHPQLMDLFLPLLKNDFRIAETDLHERPVNPLDIEFTVLLGKEDDLNAEQCDGWKIHTTQLCSIHHFEGGHFFLHDKAPQLVGIINNTLNKAGKEIPQPISETVPNENTRG